MAEVAGSGRADASQSDIKVEVNPSGGKVRPGGSFLSRILSAFGVAGASGGDAGASQAADPDGAAAFKVEVGPQAVRRIIEEQQSAVTRVYRTLQAVNEDLRVFFPQVPQVFAPVLEGRLLNPDGSPARRVSVEALEPEYAGEERAGGAVAWPAPRATTDDRGAFGIKMPSSPIPQNGLRLRVLGGNAAEEISVRRVDLEGGRLGAVPLGRPVTPLPRSITARLKDIVPTSGDDVEEDPGDFAEPTPALTFGSCECEDEESCECAHSFRSNCGVIDRFCFTMLVRLIEPQVMPKQLALRESAQDGRYTALPALRPGGVGPYSLESDTILSAAVAYGDWGLVDRIPVAAPVDVTAFRTDIEQRPAGVPKAASLSLGYVICLNQTWIPVGMSLGDMLYALPLAPGEQQRVAVHEKFETLAVSDSESLTMDETQRFRESADSSTLAVFDSAYSEYAEGGSKTNAKGDSLGAGVSTGAVGMLYGILMGTGISAGYGSSSSSGASSGWQQASRDFTTRATEDFHATLSREAAVSRRASRTGVRLAAAGEREQVTTKVVTNHNHCHALTMQYWEVLRHFSVCTKLDDIQLVCLVPLEVVQFLPTGHPRTLPTGSYTRDYLLARYAMLIRYHDVLAAHLRRSPEHTYALRLLKEFASNPTTAVQPSAGLAQDVVTVSVRGTFLPFEDLHVSAVTRGGARVGPVKMTGASAPVAANQYSIRAELMEALRQRRNANGGETRTAALMLPPSVARNDIARFELTRAFQPFSYRLKPPPFAFTQFGDYHLWSQSADASFGPGELEQHLGGPHVWDASAVITGAGVTYVNAFGGRAAAELMPTLLPLPTLRVAPLLSFSDLLRVESVFQHVLQNTVTYSKAVWSSLTPEERAILLERFTIGVPPGGVADASQEVPLLNCVANEVLGYFGNSAVMPFHIPPPLAKSMGVTSREVQEALLRFHRQGFVPPRSSITLPARGMLGEAVLGCCTSCEKIDLTRFWNWKDSPADSATEIMPGDLAGTNSLVGTGGAQGPSALVSAVGGGGGPASLVTIGAGAGANVAAPSADLLKQLMAQMPAPTAFTDLTGAAGLQSMQEKTLAEAISARSTAMTQSKEVFDALLEAYSGAKTAAATEKKEQAAAKKEEEKAADDKQKAGVKKLEDNAASYTAVAGATPDDAAALAKARTLVSSIFGDKLPPLADLASLYDKYKPDTSGQGNPSAERGKAAMLKALGLIPE